MPPPNILAGSQNAQRSSLVALLVAFAPLCTSKNIALKNTSHPSKPKTQNRRKTTRPAPPQFLRNFSESSELSDTLDSIELETSGTAKAPLETSALEEVDGVQPELQKTDRESELSSE